MSPYSAFHFCNFTVQTNGLKQGYTMYPFLCLFFGKSYLCRISDSSCGGDWETEIDVKITDNIIPQLSIMS